MSVIKTTKNTQYNHRDLSRGATFTSIRSGPTSRGSQSDTVAVRVFSSFRV